MAGYKRPTSRQASDPDRPRKGDKGVPDDMKRRYEAGEQGAGSTTFGDELDRSYEDGRKAGMKEGGSSGPKAAKPFTLAGGPGPSIPSIAAPMLVELVLISADEFVANRRPPLPSRLLVVFGIFGVLGLASEGPAANAAAAFGWGLVIATFYSTASPGAKGSGSLQALQTIGNFMSGKYAKKGATVSA